MQCQKPVADRLLSNAKEHCTMPTLRRDRARRRAKPIVEALEARTLLSASWVSYGGNAQHTALSAVGSQPLDTIRWHTPVDLNPQYNGNDLLIHYGEPLATPANTIIVPVKTGATDGFEVNAFSGSTGAALWTEPTDYTLPAHNWTPSYSPALTSTGRLYFAGAGGTLFYIDNVDGTPTTPTRVAFYGLTNYNANPSAYKASIFVDTPLTIDSNGDVFFGFRVAGSNPSNIPHDGYARIDPNGNGAWITADVIAKGIANITRNSINLAPALSNDGTVLYVGVKSTSSSDPSYLAGLDSTAMTVKMTGSQPWLTELLDPRNNGKSPDMLDDGTASPMVAPDNTVFMGIMGNPYNGSRGFLLHYSADLSQEFTPGAFGWDDTPSIVPTSMVPSYKGTSSYLIFTKYNNYVAAETGPTGGDGTNRIAILDPYNSQTDTRNDGDPTLQVMQEVMTILGPTPDTQFLKQYPNAVREWCINSCAVDPATDSVLANSEDGTLYRWNLSTGTFTEKVVLTSGIGEAYTPTLIGTDGTVYAINNATLWAVGKFESSASIGSSSTNDTAVYGEPVTLKAVLTSVESGGPVATGEVSFYDGPAVPLGTANIDNTGTATLPLSTPLSVGSHTITAVYNGDPFYTGSSASLTETITKDSTTTTLGSSANPTVSGQKVTITATVTANEPGSGIPTGTVTFKVNGTAQPAVKLNAAGQAFFMFSPTVGTYNVIATYNGGANFNFSNSSNLAQVVNKDGTTTALVSSANPSVNGQTVMLTATVTANSPGTGTPAGTVTFKVNGSNQATITLNAKGQAVFAFSPIVGTYTVTASYNGGVNFTISTSPTLHQVVNKDATTVLLVSSLNPSTFGQAVTFTAAVSAAAPGSGVPSGAVYFLDGTTIIGFGILSAGQATFKTSTLSVGSHSITGKYYGNSQFNAQTSAVLNQVVNAAAVVEMLFADLLGGPMDKNRFDRLFS
jgi:hypothetical protein